MKNNLSCGDQQTPKSDRSTKRIQDHLENSQNIRRLSRPSRSFPSHKKLSRSTRNFLNSTESFRPCGDFLNGPETFQCNIKVTRKNFPEVQKLSRSAKTFRLALPTWFLGLCRSVQVEPQGRSGSGSRAHLDPGWTRCTNLETHVAQILCTDAPFWAKFFSSQSSTFWNCQSQWNFWYLWVALEGMPFFVLNEYIFDWMILFISFSFFKQNLLWTQTFCFH